MHVAWELIRKHRTYSEYYLCYLVSFMQPLKMLRGKQHVTNFEPHYVEISRKILKPLVCEVFIISKMKRNISVPKVKDKIISQQTLSMLIDVTKRVDV